MGLGQFFKKIIKGNRATDTIQEKENNYSLAKNLITSISNEFNEKRDGMWTPAYVSHLENYKRLKESDDDTKKSVIFFILKRHSDKWKSRKGGYSMEVGQIVNEDLEKNILSLLIRSSVDLDQQDLIKIANTFNTYKQYYYWPFHPFLTRVQKYIITHGVAEDLYVALKGLKFKEHEYAYTEETKINKKIDSILNGESEQKISSRDELGKLINVSLKKDTGGNKTIVNKILEIVSSDVNKSAPSKKWLTKAEEFVNQSNVDQLSATLIPWLEVGIDKLKHIHKQKIQANSFLEESNIQILRGVVWLSAFINDDNLINQVEELGLWCFKKFPGYGAVSVKLGNGCLMAFSLMPYEVGISRLTKFRLKIKYPSVKKQVERLIEKTAKKYDKTIDQIEELAVQDYGLNEDNEYRKIIDDYTAVISIMKVNKVELHWIKPDGKLQKSIPSSIKDSAKDQIADLKKKLKEIQGVLPSQKDRIEGFYLKKREWSYKDWTKYYNDHHLISYIAKKLIWTFEESDNKVEGIWFNNCLTDVQGNPITWLSSKTKVTLWHPINSDVPTVSNWREFLEMHQIKQPFKQAHREIYIVTDAEIATETYSNRFAAHILYQFQFQALCQTRGWAYTLMGGWDSHNTPSIHLPAWDIRAEYWVDSQWNNDSEMTESGIFKYIFTDQVRIYDNSGQLNMQDVPKIVFSELMRDVDLFVGVTSIGNDPAWIDGGRDAYSTYWQNYSFGALNESAKVRREVLERLIPKLKIAKHCSFDGNFLIVEGTRRTYKIHIGSGNILMKPNDSYLCIVADRSSIKDQVFLPFEGDHQLSIILSKAMLLAADNKITDQTILNQLNK